MIIDFIDELKINTQSNSYVIVPIVTNPKIHPTQSSLAAVYIIDIEMGWDCIIPLNHSESLNNISVSDVMYALRDKNVYVYDIRTIGFEYDWIHDIELLYFLNMDSFILEISYHPYHSRWKSIKNVNKLVPISILYDRCKLAFKNASESLKKLYKYSDTVNTSLYKNYLDVLKTFNSIEMNGIMTEDGLAWTHYNVYNRTGRPSNRFNKVNYAALKKDDDTRKIYVSRHVGGNLIQFDYTAFHPTIIANYLKVDIPHNISIHEWLGREYFGVDNLTKEQYDESKKRTFYYLYGTIPHDILSIEYFSKVNDFVNSLEGLDYIETPIFKRKIDTRGFGKSKIFNYFLQAFESEINFLKIKFINNFLHRSKSCLVLYTYDSFLIDMHPDDVLKIHGIKNILEKGNFKVTIDLGKNYKEMQRL